MSTGQWNIYFFFFFGFAMITVSYGKCSGGFIFIFFHSTATDWVFSDIATYASGRSLAADASGGLDTACPPNDLARRVYGGLPDEIVRIFSDALTATVSGGFDPDWLSDDRRFFDAVVADEGTDGNDNAKIEKNDDMIADGLFMGCNDDDMPLLETAWLPCAARSDFWISKYDNGIEMTAHK